jgi:hypothetical protein
VEVVEISARWQHLPPSPIYVNVIDVQSWKPYESPIFSIGGTTIVLDQDLQTELRIAKDDAIVMLDTRPKTYLLLSRGHLIVCQVDSNGSFLHTAPTTLLNGLAPLPSDAVWLLLQGLSPASRPPPRTPIHDLNLEIRDRILEHVSECSVEAAKLRCLLGQGSPSTWLRVRHSSRRGGSFELLHTSSHRSHGTPIESKIFFGHTFNKVPYR